VTLRPFLFGIRRGYRDDAQSPSVQPTITGIDA
jgi:hypothetical protein